MIRQPGWLAWNNRSRETTRVFAAGVVGNILKGRFRGVEFGPNVAGLNLEGLDRRVEAPHAAHVFTISHGEIGFPPGVGEGVIDEFAEAGAAGQAS
ncbi:MAG: hypothetical protein RQ966_15860 [Acetobacteraceae bacterium]|nr:hypothetical protein [Acetobacteraceae bacterium]